MIRNKTVKPSLSIVREAGTEAMAFGMGHVLHISNNIGKYRVS